jgi:hypothetical protein
VDHVADTVVLEAVRSTDDRHPETVTLTHAEYEALIERIEDAEACPRSQPPKRARLSLQGKGAHRLSIELVRRLSAGEHPTRV